MTDMSLEDFLDEEILPLLQRKYPGYPINAYGDPAGAGRNDIDKRTRFAVMAEKGIRAFPASTNSFITRKETVEWFLARDEGLLISPHCVILREAFAGGYIYKKLKTDGGRTSERPDKNDYSHPMDALQYALLGAKFGYVPTKKVSTAERKRILLV